MRKRGKINLFLYKLLSPGYLLQQKLAQTLTLVSYSPLIITITLASLKVVFEEPELT